MATVATVAGTPLAAMRGLDRLTIARLRSLALDTAEQVLEAIDIAPRELERYLGAGDLDTIAKIAASAAKMPSQEEATELRSLPCALGVDLEKVPRSLIADEPVLPPESSGSQAVVAATCSDHRRVMPPIRNQQTRPTCVAFASVAVLEHWLTVGGAYQDMSEQFMYWNCKANDGFPNRSGTWCSVAFQLLGRDGVCLESTWTYVPAPQPGNEGQGPPPVGSQRQALSFRAVPRGISPTSVVDIRNALAGDRVVAFSIPVYNSWYFNIAVRDTGDITMPVPGERPQGGHAMCIVGCVDLPDRPEIGGGRFILRNSWGIRWGASGTWGAGYGSIPYAYITKHGMEAYTVT